MNLPQSLTPLDDWFNKYQITAKSGTQTEAVVELTKLLLAEQTRLKAEWIAQVRECLPKVKYTLNEVAELNKHLDSRTQQSAIDKSAGVIETIAQVTTSLDTLERGV